MFKFEKKKTLIGLLGFIVSVGLIVLFACLSPTGNIAELPLTEVIFRILALLFLSSAIGFLVLIFSDIKGFFLIFGLFAVMTLFRVLLEFTSKSSPSLTLFLISLVGIALLDIAAYNEYKTNNVAINGSSVLSSKERKEQEEIDKEIDILIKEDEALKKDIGYVENSIIVGSQGAGTLFQVIKMDKGLLFHWVGNILKGIDEAKVIKDFTNVERNKDSKKDYILEYGEIDKISATIKNNYQIMDYGNLKITLKNGKNKRFGLINLFEEKELKQFFDNKIDIINKTSSIGKKEQKVDKNDINKMNKLNRIFFILSIISSIVFGVYFMFYNRIAHAILTTLCIAICLVPFVLYIVFPKYISIKEKHRYESSVQNGKINIIHNALIFPVLFALISLIDGYMFIYYDFVKLLIYSLILFIICISILLIFTKEYKKAKSALVLIIFVFLFLSPSIVHKVNTAYDFSSPKKLACQIVEKPTWTDNNNEITYYLTINYKDKNIKTEVSKEVYEKYSVGENIEVARMKGLLGIERLILNE